MKLADRIYRRAINSGWALLTRERGVDRFYRWRDGTRIEVVVCYDEAGRVEAWSEWRNTRVACDQEPGKRARLEEFLGVTSA